MNFIVIAESRLKLENKFYYSNTDDVGLFLNMTSRPIKLTGHFYDYDYFVVFCGKLGITLPSFNSIVIIKNILETSTFETVPLTVLQSLNEELKSIELIFQRFLRTNYKFHDVYSNSYNSLQQLDNNATELVLPVSDIQKYKRYGNTTWRITNSIQNLSEYNWNEYILDIDIRAQDFTVIYNLLDEKISCDPFTHLANEIGFDRSHIKKLMQMIAFGASRDVILKTCYTEGIPSEIYHHLTATPICTKMFQFINTMERTSQLRSLYLQRPIITESGKKFSRYIQTSSSDVSLKIISELTKYKIAKYFQLFRHDEFIFYSKTAEDYVRIIDLFKTKLKTLQFNKRNIELFYNVSITNGKEIIHDENI